MTDEQDKSERDKLRDELISELAEKVAGIVTRVVIPEAFLIYESDMRDIMQAYTQAKRVKDMHRHSRSLVDAVEHMWHGCKPLTAHDMEMMMRGLDLYQAETDELKAKEDEHKPE